MQQFNLAFDAFSALLCVILGVYVMASSKRGDRINQCFIGICLCNALMAAGDMTSWIAPPLSPVEYAVMLVGTLLYYTTPALLFMFFTGYIVAYLSKRTTLTHHYLRLPALLFVLYGAACVLSLFNGMFFSVSMETGYMRGPLFLLAQALAVALHLRNTALVVRYRSYLTRKELWGFASYIALPIIAEVVQVAFYGIALMNAALALAILLVFLSIQSERKALLAQREQELAEARSDIMLSQIQPHFLYNTLAAIRELCSSDPAEAARTVTDFSTFLRQNMASLTSKDPIPFERELQHTMTYLNLEQRRFGERLRVTFEATFRDFTVPPLTVQALAENAVRHGISPREEGGYVCIASRADAREYVVMVSDDGVGFDMAAQPGGESAGAGEAEGRVHVGIANVRVRLAESCHGTLEVQSAPGKGTVATIRIPREQNPLEGSRP